MKTVQTSLVSWRRERRRATVFTLLLFTALAVAWPPIAYTFLRLGGEAVMEDVAIKEWSVKIEVDEKGKETVEEEVVIEFLKPGKYVRAVGELSSTTPNVRYFSDHIAASVDGEEVGVKAYTWGVGGKYYELEPELSGTHTVKFSYEVRDSIYTLDDGRGVFRARLLPRYSLNDVDSFSADIVIPNMDVDTALCWTSEAVKDPDPEDTCDFVKLTPDRAVIELENIEYLRPVRFNVELEPDDYSAYRLPWSGYWDPVLGKTVWSPLLILLASFGLAFLPKLYARLAWGDRKVVLVALAGAGGMVLILWGFFSFSPSLAFLLPGVVLYSAIPAYLRSSESRLLVEPPVEEKDAT